MDAFEQITFPVYRKYKNDKSWFRITGPGYFEEIRLIGSRLEKSAHAVKTLPERNFLYDLVFQFEDFADEITASEFESVAEKLI